MGFSLSAHFRNHLTTLMKTAAETLAFPLIWCSSSLGFSLETVSFTCWEIKSGHSRSHEFASDIVNLVQKLQKQADPNDEHS